MGFPIQFAKSTGDYDFFSPIINVTGNAAVLAVGGLSLGALSYVALKALGFSKMATSIATAVPVSIGAIGVVVAIGGSCTFIALCVAISKAMGRR